MIRMEMIQIGEPQVQFRRIRRLLRQRHARRYFFNDGFKIVAIHQQGPAPCGQEFGRAAVPGAAEVS